MSMRRMKASLPYQTHLILAPQTHAPAPKQLVVLAPFPPWHTVAPHSVHTAVLHAIRALAPPAVERRQLFHLRLRTPPAHRQLRHLYVMLRLGVLSLLSVLRLQRGIDRKHPDLVLIFLPLFRDAPLDNRFFVREQLIDFHELQVPLDACTRGGTHAECPSVHGGRDHGFSYGGYDLDWDFFF